MQPIDTRQFRDALGRFASGVTVVTARHKEQTLGMTASAFVSVSLDPPLVLVSLDNRSSLHSILAEVGRYGVSVLSENQEVLSNHFAGRKAEGLVPRFILREEVPLLEYALAHFVVDVIDAHPAGDHTLYIGRVRFFDWRDGAPLLFFSGRYRQTRPEAPKAAQWREDEFSLFSIGSMDPL